MRDVAPNMNTYGLLAPQAVFWLVAKEREVWERMIAFIGDAAPSEMTVVGPATIAQTVAYKSNPKGGIMLPTVKLKMRKIKHHLTGQPMIEMTCSDAHLEDITSWQVLDSYKANELRPEELRLARELN